MHRPVDNCRQVAYGIEHLDAWLGSGHWDVIHFNFGLHDMKYLDPQGRYVTPDKGTQVAPPGQYEANLRRLVARLRKTGARLVFATTTPVPEGAEGRVKGDEARYNQIALAVMREAGVDIDDLGALAARDQARIQLPHNVHFTPEGYRELAAAAADSIAAELRKASQ